MTFMRFLNSQIDKIWIRETWARPSTSQTWCLKPQDQGQDVEPQDHDQDFYKRTWSRRQQDWLYESDVLRAAPSPSGLPTDGVRSVYSLEVSWIGSHVKPISGNKCLPWWIFEPIPLGWHFSALSTPSFLYNIDLGIQRETYPLSLYMQLSSKV